MIVGSFTACSNVNGVCEDTDEVAKLLHAHGALSFWDYATAAPYVRSNYRCSSLVKSRRAHVFVSVSFYPSFSRRECPTNVRNRHRKLGKFQPLGLVCFIWREKSTFVWTNVQNNNAAGLSRATTHVVCTHGIREHLILARCSIYLCYILMRFCNKGCLFSMPHCMETSS